MKKKWLYTIILGALAAALIAGGAWGGYIWWKQESRKQERAEALAKGDIALYLYDGHADLAADGAPRCSESSLVRVLRTVGAERANITYAIAILLSGEMTDEERAAGYVPLFPSTLWKLTGSTFSEGALSLSFEKMGEGEDRCTRLAALQLEKTLKEFPSITSVRLEPVDAFGL